MIGVIHLAVGMAIGAVVSKNGLVGAGVGGLAGVIPDLDAENSWLQIFLTKKGKSVWTDFWFGKSTSKDIFSAMIMMFLAIMEIGIRAILMAIIGIFKLFVSHRGITHTLIAGLVASGTIVLFNLNYGLSFLAGYWSHICLDAMTKSGVRMFLPFSKKTIYLLPEKYRIKTVVKYKYGYK